MQASTNYIYIIFAVVYVIYSIIKAGKKVAKNRPTIDPQQSQPTVQPPTASPLPQQDFKKILEDLMGVPPEKIPEPQIQKVETPIQKSQPVKISIKNAPRKQAVAVSRVPEKSIHSPHYEAAKKVFAEPVAIEEPVPDTYRENFDIREAVIYSEILKRPEY